MHHHSRWLIAAIVVLATTSTAPADAAAQIVYPGDTRVEMSDVTGPPLTSGDLLGPGTVRSFTCPVAWGVRTGAEIVRDGLRSGTLPAVAAAWRGDPLPESTRRDLLLVLSDAEGEEEAARRLIESLAPAAGASAGARDAASGLVSRLDGLLENATRLRPRRPGHRTATQLAGVVGAYNTYIEASSAELLRSPPDALLGVQAVLSRLLVGALENQGRPSSRASEVGGLACAAPPAQIIPQPPEPPALPVERAAVVCVVADDGLRAIGAIVLASGDTLVVTDGRRLPFGEAYPDTISYAADAPWYAQADAITVNGRRYVRFGLPRLAAPDAALRRVGEYEGVPLFAEPGEDHLVVPVQPECLIQDYRPERELRVRG